MGVRRLCQLTHSGSTRRPLGGRTPPTVPALEAKKGTPSLRVFGNISLTIGLGGPALPPIPYVPPVRGVASLVRRAGV